MQRNRLAAETSPYLLQHADNPVDWYPWGEEALARARRENKPILLSVGYSACHWCHVMAHESFEDPATAALMNRLFVNIKVDREERPDLDKIYQVAQQLITQRAGGWPLTMFLTPEDQQPFFGGTYFPKEAAHGMPAFSGSSRARGRVLPRPWRGDPRSRTRNLAARLRAPAGRADGRRATASPSMGRRCGGARGARAAFDARFGGFGAAPEVPAPRQHRALPAPWHALRSAADLKRCTWRRSP